MHSIHEILSVRFGIYYATVNRSLELTLSDSDLLGYLGAARPAGPVHILDLFPELVGLEADIAAVLNGESDGFCVPTVNRVPERDIFFDLHLFIYRPADGTALLVVRDATAEGISLRKVQQRRNDLLLKNQELVQREEFVRTLLDTMPNPVYYTDPDSMFLGCNTSFAAFLGKERDDIIGRRVAELLTPGAAAAFMGLGAESAESCGAGQCEESVKDGRGDNALRHLNRGTLPGADGSPAGIVGVLSDITERRAMENRLRELGTAVEKSPASIIITDASGRMVYVNPKFLEVTGFSPDETIGNNPRILKSGSHGPEFYRGLWETILSGNVWYGEIQNRKKNGDLYWELVSISPIRDAGGKITNFVAVKEDITNLKNAMNRIEAREKELRIRNEIMEQNMLLAKKTLEMYIDFETPVAEGFNIACRYKPMEGIGGDYYFVKRRGGGLTVFICDIAGHGVAAALFLTLVKYFSDRLLRDHTGRPGEFLEKLNDSLYSNMSFYFVTGIYGELDPGENAVFRFANGGHPAPVLMRKDGSVEFLGDSNTIIGMKSGMEFDSIEERLVPGDRLFLYTDGIPEARNGESRMISMEMNLLDVFARSRRGTLEETMDAVMREIESYRGDRPPDDDILLLGFEIQ